MRRARRGGDENDVLKKRTSFEDGMLPVESLERDSSFNDVQAKLDEVLRT